LLNISGGTNIKASNDQVLELKNTQSMSQTRLFLSLLVDRSYVAFTQACQA